VAVEAASDFLEHQPIEMSARADPQLPVGRGPRQAFHQVDMPLRSL